jgi:flagellin-like protein
MQIRKKRGISPVIATVLLISITIVLALIIWVWAKSFILEKTEKFGEPIEFSCERVNFDAEAFTDSIDIVNRGNVPLYGIEIKERGRGSVTQFNTFTKTITSGGTDTISITDPAKELSGELTIVPVVVGENNGIKTSFTCDDSFGITTTVV